MILRWWKALCSGERVVGSDWCPDNEETECTKSEFESVEVVDMSGRAISIVQRRWPRALHFVLKKNFTRSTNNVIPTFSAMADAATFPSAEVALVQSRHDDSEVPQFLVRCKRISRS